MSEIDDSEEIRDRQTALINACRSGDIDTVRRAIAGGVDVNYQSDLVYQVVNQVILCTGNGSGTVCVLVEVNRIFQHLLDKNKGLGPIDDPSKYGKVLKIPYIPEDTNRILCYARVREKDMAPLHEAVMNGHQDIVELLVELEKGVDPEIKDYFGNTARDLAVSKGDKKMMNKLWPTWTKEEGEHLKAVARMTEQPKLLEYLEETELYYNSMKRVQQPFDSVCNRLLNVVRGPDNSLGQSDRMSIINALRQCAMCADEEWKNVSLVKQDEIQPGLMTQNLEGLDLNE